VGVGWVGVGVGVGVGARVGVGVGVGFREADGDADAVGYWDEYTDGDDTPADRDVPGNDDVLDEGDAPREVDTLEGVRPADVDPVDAEI
jgi:hypothetical protein